MLYPAMSELLKNVDSRYLLVNVVAHRARQLSIRVRTHARAARGKACHARHPRGCRRPAQGLRSTINTDTELKLRRRQPPAPVLLNTAEELNFMKICVKSVCTSPLVVGVDAAH